MKKPMIKALALSMALTMALSAPMTASAAGLADLYRTSTETDKDANNANGTEDPGKDTKDPGKDTKDPGKDTKDPGKDTKDPGKDTKDPGKDTKDPGKDTKDPGKIDPEGGDVAPEVAANVLGISLSPSYAEIDKDETTKIYATVLLDTAQANTSATGSAQVAINAANAAEYDNLVVTLANGTTVKPADLLKNIGYTYDTEYLDVKQASGILEVTGKKATPVDSSADITATLAGTDFEAYAFVDVKGYTTAMSFKSDSYDMYKNHTLYFANEIVRDGNDDLTWELSAYKVKADGTLKSTSAKSYATITTYGMVTAKKATKDVKLVVTARSEHGVTASTEIVITDGNPVKKIKIEPAKLKLELGDGEYPDATAAVTLTTNDGKPTTDNVRISLNKNNKNLGYVWYDESEGKIHVDSISQPGTAKYTVQSTSGKKATFTLQVTANKLVSIDWISYNGNEHIYAGQKTKAYASTTPYGYKGKIEYELVSENELLTVNKKTGAISVKKGKKVEEPQYITIKATGKNTDVAYEQGITVWPNPVTGISFTDKLDGGTLYIGTNTRQTFDYNVKVDPVDAGLGEGDGLVTYSVNNNKIAYIDSRTGELTPIKSGKVKVTASVTLANGKVKKVTDTAVIKTVASKITIKTPNVVKFTSTKDQKITLKASFTKGYGDAETVEWTKVGGSDSIDFKANSSTTKTSATIVIAKNTLAGETAEFLVTAKNGATARATITVCDKASKVSFKEDLFKVGKSYKAELTRGESLDLTEASGNLIVSYAEGATTKEPVTYTVNKKGIVTIKNGVVYGVKAGTVKVTAKTASGKKATITITVVEPTK